MELTEHLQEDRSLTDTRGSSSHDVCAGQETTVIRYKLVDNSVSLHRAEETIIDLEIIQLSELDIHWLLRLGCGYFTIVIAVVLSRGELTVIHFDNAAFILLEPRELRVVRIEGCLLASFNVGEDHFVRLEFHCIKHMCGV